VDADGVAERRKESPGEELDPLGLVQRPGAREERLEAVLVLRDRPGAPTVRELEQGCGSEWWSIPKVEEVGEAFPRWDPLVVLDLDPPELSTGLQVVAGHPHLVLLHGALLMEERLATVEEDEGVGGAVILGKIQLLEARWWSVGVGFRGCRLGA
jgi:hypothetical protein